MNLIARLLQYRIIIMEKQMRRDYRKRIPLNDTMRKNIFQLIEEEGDTTIKKKKHPAKWYRAKVAEIMKLSEKTNSSVRSYEDFIKYVKKYLQKRNPLDNSWSFGSLINYPIPQEKIIEVWTLCENLRTGGPIIDIPLDENSTLPTQWYNKLGVKWLTIRQVRWYIILRSIPLGLEDNSVVPTSEFDIRSAILTVVPTSEIHIRSALLNAFAYAMYERQCELTNNPVITIDLDSNTLKKMTDLIHENSDELIENEKYLHHKRLS